MTANTLFDIAVLPGDGIGAEVVSPCLALMQAAAERVGGFGLSYRQLPAGAQEYLRSGVALPNETLKECRAADAILLGAMGWPEVRYENGTEIAPQLDLRTELGLFAGVRPARALPGVAPVLADQRAANLDFVIIRESVEGLFALRDEGQVIDDREARDTMVITRAVCEQLFDFSFAYARQRKQAGGAGRLTCVDKANVFASMAFFRKIFDERSKGFGDIEADHAYVDATALNLVRRPWDLDVIVTENMFGDILSDLAAGLIGGMGYAPSADIGLDHAVFQPCHGSAPDITGKGVANPTATILSGAMMLDWLGRRHDVPQAVKAGQLLSDAVDEAFRRGIRPFESGGDATTETVAEAVMDSMGTLSHSEAS
ncbi:isocitrate/isopropylmalate dehydrogenase family protein [Devosia nitrariae]|uniref:3-isopropylmalate dehydrogenase n=1 Tax=Devosia nitrariae TaxID=2071872 RepID=A0ABQ5W635_9HYPH|nr:isocitrate/isopropylmalate dehydrogenase family protein [Devosia nitrariae]GLQ55401.1 3-isopropylmalate dehydrogenase [Devosia nitrariae]